MHSARVKRLNLVLWHLRWPVRDMTFSFFLAKLSRDKLKSSRDKMNNYRSVKGKGGGGGGEEGENPGKEVAVIAR